MRKIFCLLGCLLGCYGFAQDAIVLINGKTIWSKVALIDQTTIKYKRYENLDGPDYLVEKKEVSYVKFQNGVIERFDSPIPKDISKEGLQAYIVEKINSHGFDDNDADLKYRATFEGDYLVLGTVRKNGKPSNDDLVYDFSNIYAFRNIDRRSDQLVFINIIVSVATNKKRTDWDKHKLVMRVDNLRDAELITEALKRYNTLLKTKGN